MNSNHSLARAHEELNAAWRALQQQWQSLRDDWRDDRARRFEKESWPPFEEATPSVLREMDALNRLIQQAQRDVKEP